MTIWGYGDVLAAMRETSRPRWAKVGRIHEGHLLRVFLTWQPHWCPSMNLLMLLKSSSFVMCSDSSLHLDVVKISSGERELHGQTLSSSECHGQMGGCWTDKLCVYLGHTQSLVVGFHSHTIWGYKQKENELKLLGLENVGKIVLLKQWVWSY